MEADESAPPVQKMKLLIHNVSHADLCMTLQPECVLGIDPARELMARPRSSRYKYVCEEISNAITNGCKYSGIAFKDKQSHSRYVGFLFNPPARICSWSDFRLRNPDSHTISQSLSVFVVRVFFPLVSVLLPKWIALHQKVPPPTPYHAITLSPRPEPAGRSVLKSDGTITGKGNVDEDGVEGSLDLNESTRSNRTGTDSQTTSTQVISRHSMNGDHKESEVSHRALALRHHDSTPQRAITINGSKLVTEYTADSTKETMIYKLFLVSGAGHPLKNESAYYEDDSTQQLSRLLCRFIRDFYPQIVVTQYYSKQDIFQYAENIKFVHSTLRPAIDHERSAMAMLHGKYWKKYFNVSITLCDGTPARLSAIIEGLRSFEPDMLHMYRRKSLWADYPHVDRLWDQDMEYLKFAQMETYPAIPVVDIHDEAILNTINELRAWKSDFLEKAVEDEQSEMSRFWLRKTRQPVLAVLAVQKPEDERPTYYRGVNVEVSMPTGSLCAERNAIGAAIAADPSLRREHFKMVAVLFMAELDEKPTTPRFSPAAPPVLPSETPTSFEPLFRRSRSAPQGQRVSFFGGVEAKDTNPRGPCGSCMEWLKKIAQCNPSFKVITFSSRTLEKAIVRNLK